MLDPAVYLDHLRRDAAAVATAARANLTASVPSCPGWTVAALVTHLTGVYAVWTKLVREHARELNIKSVDDFDLTPEEKRWFETRGLGPAEPPPWLLDVFVRATSELEQTLRAARPDEPVWTWWPPDQTVGFWQRRAALETAIHRWDAQLARGTPDPVDAELASDGIDELFDIVVPAGPILGAKTRPGQGERYHFHRTDGPGEWLVRFGSDGVVVTREHAKGDVAVRGSASDLFLWLWHRVPADRLEVFGDRALLDRYFELAPPI